jgi:hypothetical protein
MPLSTQAILWRHGELTGVPLWASYFNDCWNERSICRKRILIWPASSYYCLRRDLYNIDSDRKIALGRNLFTHSCQSSQEQSGSQLMFGCGAQQLYYTGSCFCMVSKQRYFTRISPNFFHPSIWLSINAVPIPCHFVCSLALSVAKLGPLCKRTRCVWIDLSWRVLLSSINIR